MVEEAYVSFETAKLLKEKGFDLGCFGYYVDDEPEDVKYSSLCETNSIWEARCCSAPTQQMAMRWLREEKGTSIIIEFDVTKRGYCPYVYQLDYDMDWVVKWRINMPMEYEEAVEAAIKYCLENLI